MLSAALLLFCGGCAWVGTALEELGGNTAEETEIAHVTEPPDAAPTEAHAEPENPVFTLYSGFLDTMRIAQDGLTRSAAEAEDADIAAMYSALCGCEAELALIYSTVGMLASEGSGWSGSFTGSFSGSGAMSSRGVFEYDFDDERIMAGRIEDGLLWCSLGMDVEPIDDEPTPAPTDSEAPVSSESAEAFETAEATGTAETEDTPAPTEEAPTEAPAAVGSVVWGANADWNGVLEASRTGTVFMALKQVGGGYRAIVVKAGKPGCIALTAEGAEYITDASAAVLAGFDPLTDEFEEALNFGCAALRYYGGAAELIRAEV